MPPPVTISQIAKLARVSRTAVSLALRESPKVAEPVRRRVRVVANQLGYRANPLVNAHMAYVRTMRPRFAGQRLAFVSHLTEEEMEAQVCLPHRFFLRGARTRARSLGYELEAHRLAGQGVEARRLEALLHEREVSGVIFPPLTEGAALTGLDLDLRPFATVMIEHAFIAPRLHKVCVDQFATIGRLIQRMVDHGFARPGIALPRHMDEHACHSWLAGYAMFQELSAAAQRVPHFIAPRWNREDFLAWFRNWRPDAIITIDPDIVVWLREAGIDVPGEVACATLSWTARAPEMSGFHQNGETLGAAAVDEVVAQLARNERGIPPEQRTLLVEACWREGTTLPRRTASAPAAGKLTA